MEASRLNAAILKHNVQLRLLSQIQHFTNLKEVAEHTLELLPVGMPKTARSYKNKIDKCRNLIEQLTKSYQKIK